VNVAQRIKHRREELGLTDSYVALNCGLSTHEYWDIEHHADEICEVAQLAAVKKILKILRADFFDFFSAPCFFCEERKGSLEDYQRPRNELIRAWREKKGWSREELGDRVGFYEVEMQNLENDPNHIESWCLADIQLLATELDLPLQYLLDVKCKKCSN
jgi:transcriptional regulator with XRE-family HTH domain